MLHPLSGEEVKVEIERDGKEKTIMVDPNYTAYLFGFSYKQQNTADTKISDVSKDSPFQKAGVKAGDEILSVNGRTVDNGEELGKVMEEEKKEGEAISFVIRRGSEEKTYEIAPKSYKTKTLGIYASDYQKGNAGQILRYSLIEVKYWIETTVASLGQLVTGKMSMKEVSGPVGIVDTVGTMINETSKIGLKEMWLSILYMAVLLSANLGVMNLLPLPALDGVFHRPADFAKAGIALSTSDSSTYAFLAYIAHIKIRSGDRSDGCSLFMVFVLYNDVIKIIH